ncbi:MAG: transposase [Nitrospira sp.]|nr:transposase [Nitrospira sp.]
MARRRGHTEEQILAALRQAESGTTVTEICRTVGASASRCSTCENVSMRGWASASCANSDSCGKKTPS